MSDGRLLVRPGKGCLVRLPDGRRLTEDGRNFTFKCPAAGVEVRWSLYIQRRIECGDLVDVNEADPDQLQLAAAGPRGPKAKARQAPKPVAKPAPAPAAAPAPPAAPAADSK